jgi:Fe-S-cluster containining protein
MVMVELLNELKNGFWFKCQECGRCCTGIDDGYVFLFGDEIKKICNKLNITADQFLEEYCEIIEAEYRIFTNHKEPTKSKVFLSSIVLKQDEKEGICVFLDKTTNHCKIYDTRPLQCHTWPSWYMNMTRKDNLVTACEKCPGINLEKDITKILITPQEILRNIETEIEIEQNYINKMESNKGNLKKVHPYLKNVNKKID